MFILSVRSKSDEVRVSDSDSSRRWTVIPATSTDVTGDANSEPGATVKSLIRSFDTVGQSKDNARAHYLESACHNLSCYMLEDNSIV